MQRPEAGLNSATQPCKGDAPLDLCLLMDNHPKVQMM